MSASAQKTRDRRAGGPERGLRLRMRADVEDGAVEVTDHDQRWRSYPPVVP
jgi:hypothetical protein